jgi:microcystin-dependent protein
MSPGVDLVEGTLILGTPYIAVYNHAAGAFYLRGVSSPYNVPFLAGMDYWDTVTPSSAFIFPLGQALSRSVYARAFARWGTKFGAGDGSTTFNAPNKAGRVSAMIEPSPSLLTANYFGGNSANIGAVGGLESNTLTTDKIPAHSHANTLTDPGHAHGTNAERWDGTLAELTLGSVRGTGQAATVNSATTGITINNASAGGGSAHANVQPTIVCNYIIRVL